MLKSNRYLCDHLKTTPHTSVDGKLLDEQLINITAITSNNREVVLKEVLVNKKKRTDLALQQVFVLPSEREEAQKITKLKKPEILSKIEERIQMIIDGDAKESFMAKFTKGKGKLNSTTKKKLIALYDEASSALSEANLQPSSDCHQEEEPDDLSGR